MEYMTELTADYVPLSLVPQPLKHSKPGQQRLKPSKSVAKLKGRSEATTINAELCIVNPELIATKRLLQERYGLEPDGHERTATGDEDAATTAQQPPHLLQRKLALQQLEKHKLRAAAVRSTAEAMQEWFKWGGPAICPAADALSAKALLVLNAEAEKGLLHLISTGLMPEEMDLTPGLCGGPHSPLTFKPTQLHPLEAKQAAASGTLAQSAVVSSPRPVAVKKPPAHSASWSPSDQQQSMALQSHASLSAPVGPQPAQLPHAAVADAEPGVGSAASAVELQPRGYEALLDDLSEHQLLIHKGKLVQDTPEVLSFIRVAVPLWSTVSVLLSQLEALCRVFNVQLAVIDGKEVLQLAQTLIACSSSSSSNNTNSSRSDVEKQMPRSKPAAELSDLLCCIANLDELEHLFSSVSEEMAAAALHVDNPVNTAETVISQCSRVIVSEPDPGTVGNDIKQPATDVSSANGPQAAGQSTTVVSTTGVAVEKSATVRVPAKVFKAAEGTLLETMYQARHERDAVFQQLQHSLRHHWPQIKQQPHVVLHLPSIPAEQHQLHQLLCTSISQQQHQLWRVLDVATDHTCHASEAETDGSSQAAQPQQIEHDPSSEQPQRTLQPGDSCRKCVVLVTSQPVNKQLQSHWYQLLRIAGVAEPSSSVRFVSTAPADEAQALDPTLATLPLSARLMASHRALDRCKHIVTGVSSIRSASQPAAAAAAAAGVNPQQPQLVCDREVLHVQKLEGSKHSSPDVDKAIDGVSRDNSNSTKSVPAGYIVPGCPSEQDCDVAVKLGLPILGPTPQLAHVLSSRIGARSLFAAAGIRLPPGGVLPRTSHISRSPNSSNSSSAADLADWQQLLSGMCMQLLRHPQQAQWMIKLNVGLNGARGLAVLDLAAMQATQSALVSAVQVLNATREQQQQPAHQQQQTPQVEPLQLINLSTVPADQLQAALQQMVPALASELHLGLQLLQPAYWLQQAVGTNAVSDAASDEQLLEAAVEAYLLELLCLGGTMEAFLSDIVCCPLVQLLLEPDGHITVIATQDKIMHEGCSSPGSLFPSGCPAHAALVQAATAAGEAAMAAGMLGYLQMAFICTRASSPHIHQAAEHECDSRRAAACSEHVSHESDGPLYFAEGQNQQQQQQQRPRCSIGGSERTVTPSVLLWGCDFLPWPSPDLAMFRLFHTVKQGQFDSGTGQYVVLRDAAEQQQQQQQQQDEEEQENVGPQQGWQPQHCSYACLHNPAAVIPPQQLSVVAQKSLLAPAADMASHHAKRGNYGHTMQPLLSQTVLHSFGTSGEVIVSMEASSSSGCQCVDHGTCTDCLSERGPCTGGVCTGNGGKTAAPSSREEQHPAADTDVSGILCCSTGYEAVGALSCLSGLISNLATALQE